MGLGAITEQGGASGAGEVSPTDAEGRAKEQHVESNSDLRWRELLPRRGDE